MTSTAMTASSYSGVVAGEVSGRSQLSGFTPSAELFTPPPTSVTLVAALMLLDTPLLPRPSNGNSAVRQSGEHVFLLTRQYLQNWLCWAYHQPVAPQETERVKLALRMAASMHKLTPPSDSTTSFHEPAPIDSFPLSVWGHPLLLRPNVVVVTPEARAIDENLSATATVPMPKSQRSHSFSGVPPGANEEDLDKKPAATQEGDQVECCAVPERFYELLRSIHGVLCDDNFSVSFQPFDGSSERSAAMHHHVLNSTVSKKDPVNGPSSNDITMNGHGKTRSDQGYSPREQPRPVEFRRKVIFILAYARSPTSGAVSPMSRLLDEEKSKGTEIAAVVELYPIKFWYSVVGGDMDRETSRSTSPARSMANTEVEITQSSPSQAKSTATMTGETNPEPNAKGTGMKTNTSAQKMSSSAPSSPRMKKEKPPLGSARKNRKPDGASHPVPKDSDSDEPDSPVGFVLVSRTSLVADALQALIKEAAPDKSSTCVRVWVKMDHTIGGNDKQTRATRNGDDYELVLLDCLDGQMIPKKEESKENDTKPMTPAKSTITVADWVKRQTGDNAKSVSILVETRTSPSTKWPRDQLQLDNRIQVGDFVDGQDISGKWYESVVCKVDDDTVTVHYAGWASRWDTRIRRRNHGRDIIGKNMRIRAPMPLWTHTTRWRENIKVGDIVEIREASSLVQRPRWFRATVRAVGNEEDPVRETLCGAELETYDFKSESGDKEQNGTESKMEPLLLLNRRRQVLLEVPQEKNNAELSPASSRKVSGASDGHAQQSPFLRWVNLYGEEICKAGTHLEIENDNRPATLSYQHDKSKPPVEVLKSFNGIHGAGFVRESLRGVPPAPGSVGLHNLGNSCFLNSIVQCLNHIESLTQYFLKGKYRQELNRKNPLGSGGRVAVAYASLLNDMWGGDYSILAPRMLKQTIGYFAPQFNNVHQHDSQEFCQFLMDGLHEDLNRVKNKPYVEELEGRGMEDEKVAILSWQKHLLRHDSVIVDQCQGMHRSHLTCPVCGRISIKFDVYSSISLPLPPEKTDSIDLRDCLEMFTVGEQLDEHNAWYCPSCKKHVCALKMIALWSVPDILILHLKRFTFNTCKQSGGVVRSKIEDMVKFPIENLDMSEYILGPVDPDSPPVYKLFGVSEHSGSTANSGHYTATVRNSRDGKWYRYNDSHVGSTSGDAAITPGAYVLFYQRSKGSSRWAGMEKMINERGSLDIDEDGFKEVKSKKKGRKKRGKTSPKRS